MRNLLAFSAALLLTFTGVGWYLGWYKLQSLPSSNGQRSVQVNFNTKKISQDFRAGARVAAERLKKWGEEKPVEEQSPFEQAGFTFGEDEEPMPDPNKPTDGGVPRIPAPEFGGPGE